MNIFNTFRDFFFTSGLLALFIFSPLQGGEPEIRTLDPLCVSTVTSEMAQCLNEKGFQALNRKEWPLAERYFLEAVRQNPSVAAYYNNLGIVYLNQQQYDDAVLSFDTALSVDANHCRSQVNLALAHFKNGSYYQAAKSYLKAKSCDEAYVKHRFDSEKANQLLSNAEKNAPDSLLLKLFKKRAAEETSALQAK